MGTKTAVAFSVFFFKADLEKRLLMASHSKPLVWKRFRDDLFSLWNISMQEVSSFVNFANTFRPTIKFTFEMSSERAVFVTLRSSKDLVFQLIKSLTYKHISSLQKLFNTL